MPFGIHGKIEIDASSIYFYFLFHRPWMVSLFASPRYGWNCAGVLVNENTILTAAHCLVHTTAKQMKAIIGVHTILGKLNPLNYYSIKTIYRHPKFEACCKNDIAILKLSKSVLYGPRINSVCLPFEPYSTVDYGREFINRTGVIIGWGDSSHNHVTNMFKSFTLQQGKQKKSNKLILNRCLLLSRKQS